jgi:hypothetical protein
MRTIPFLIFFSLISISAVAHSLDEYPSMFVSSGKVNAIVVVDDGAPASYVIVQSGIALSLNEKAGASQQGVAKLSSEVGKLDRNTISIGNPCENGVSRMILENGEDCHAGFERGRAKIELVYDEAHDLTHIVAGGYTEKGTLEAAKKLKDASTNRLGEFSIIEWGVDEPLEAEKENQEVPTHDITQEEKPEEQVGNQPPIEEHPSGQQETEQIAQEPEQKEGLFQQFFLWLRSLFG